MLGKQFYTKYVKRCIDIILAIVMLICFCPIILVTALLIKRKLGSPVLFKQERAGLNGKPFKMFKFRSMTNDVDEKGNLLPDEQRLTNFGKKLRSLSIDELPGLFNVFKGEMSVIGPRPLPVTYLEHYDEFQMRRHEVKPGIVGFASVRGRNNQSWDSKFKNDIEYVESISFITDLKIFLKAIVVVLKREDVNRDGYATGEVFIKKNIEGEENE